MDKIKRGALWRLAEFGCACVVKAFHQRNPEDTGSANGKIALQRLSSADAPLTAILSCFILLRAFLTCYALAAANPLDHTEDASHDRNCDQAKDHIFENSRIYVS